MADRSTRRTTPRPPPPRGRRLTVTPPLAPDDVVFLAGFGRRAVLDHDGARLALPRRVPRLWPGRPAGPCPWVPCADGCCLRLDGPAGVVVAGAWLRFLLAEFLDGSHAVEGAVELPGPGRARAVLIADRTEVFEGEVDVGDAADSRPDGTPWPR